MNMERTWETANMISAILGLVISAFLVAKFYIPYVLKRKTAYITGIVFFLVMTVLYFVPFTMSGVVAYIIGITAVFVTTLISEKRNIPQKIFLAMTIYLFIWIAQGITSLPWELISSITYAREGMDDAKNQFIWFIVALILMTIIKKVLLFLEILISEKVYVRKGEQVEWRELIILVAPFIAIMSGYWISSFLSDVYVEKSGVYVWNDYPIYDGIETLFGIIAFIAVITVMYSYQQIKKSQEEAMQNLLISKQVEELSEHISTMEKMYSEFRSIRHDMNDHLMVLGNLIDKKEHDEALTYLKEWKKGFPMPEINVKTGNLVTDIIISEKKSEAERSGIEFTQNFCYPVSGKVESIDIGIILNNALSNAIRGAEKCDNPKIEIMSWKNNNAYLIQVKNSYAGELTINHETGLPQTTKSDKENHGYGLLNIKRIAEKYYGTIQLEQEDGKIVFTAMLMIPE